MASLNPPVCDFGWKAPDFNLMNIDGNMISRDQIMGKNGLLVMFISNHCPYVKAIQTRLVHDCRELLTIGVNTIAIQSNDVINYPEDDFDSMVKVAKIYDFSFPYVWDKSQAIAKSYNAVCTPDFFGFNQKGELQYRGRFDAAGRNSQTESSSRELFNAMKLIAETGVGPKEQVASIGCSIKWFQKGTS